MATSVFRRLCMRRISVLPQSSGVLLPKHTKAQEFAIPIGSSTSQFTSLGTAHLLPFTHNARLMALAACNSQRYYSVQGKSDDDEEKKPSIFARFKQMYRDYWYVLVPVHLVTSVGWFGSFYYFAKSGVDVVSVLESLHISEKIINPLKDSSMGYVAIAYALYKIATPFRYTVTLGGTTISINYLKKWGYIRPVPSRQELRNIYMEKKENLVSSVKDKKEELMLKKEQLKDRTDDLIGSVEKKIINKISTKAEMVGKKSTFGGKE